MAIRDFFSTTRPELRKLYTQAGGADGVEQILLDFYRRMSQDVLIGFFFEGKDVDAVARRQMEFLLRAMGVSQEYTGKFPAQAHSDLPPILPGHFDRRLTILEQTLRDHSLPDDDIRTWLSFENAFRDVIVTQN